MGKEDIWLESTKVRRSRFLVISMALIFIPTIYAFLRSRVSSSIPSIWQTHLPENLDYPTASSTFSSTSRSPLKSSSFHLSSLRQKREVSLFSRRWSMLRSLPAVKMKEGRTRGEERERALSCPQRKPQT